MTLELPKEIEAARTVQARAASMSPDQYLARLLEPALTNQRREAAERLCQYLTQPETGLNPSVASAELEAALDEALATIRPIRRWSTPSND